jgi:hypothetical protein
MRSEDEDEDLRVEIADVRFAKGSTVIYRVNVPSFSLPIHEGNASLMRSLRICHPNVLAEKPCKRLDKSAKSSLVFFDGASKGPDGADPELGPNNHVLWIKIPRPLVNQLAQSPRKQH